MKIDRTTIHAALVELERLTRKSVGHPILAYVLIEANDDEVKLITTDLEHTIRFNLPAETPRPFTTCLPAKLLTKIVKPESRREAGVVTIEPLPDRVDGVTIDGVTSKIASLDPLEFPPSPRRSLRWIGP